MMDFEYDNGTKKDSEHTCVLLVEDEPAARKASKLYLISRGFKVATAGDAGAALEEAAMHIPDVVVCDWRLGAGGDGVDVARKLQWRYDVPVIFVTAHPIDELRDAAADLDVSRFLKKPVSLPVLAEAIADVSP